MSGEKTGYTMKNEKRKIEAEITANILRFFPLPTPERILIKPLLKVLYLCFGNCKKVKVFKLILVRSETRIFKSRFFQLIIR